MLMTKTEKPSLEVMKKVWKMAEAHGPVVEIRFKSGKIRVSYPTTASVQTTQMPRIVSGYLIEYLELSNLPKIEKEYIQGNLVQLIIGSNSLELVCETGQSFEFDSSTPISINGFQKTISDLIQWKNTNSKSKFTLIQQRNNPDSLIRSIHFFGE